MINYKKHIKGMITRGVIVLFVFISLNSFSQSNSPLDSVITYKVKNLKLFETLIDIGNIIEYEFSYNSDLIETNKLIKGKYEDITVRNLLKAILKDTTLIYKIVDKQIVIYRNNSFNQLKSYQNLYGTNNPLIIEGTIVDINSKKPLSYANVSILGQSSGTISNEQGYFIFKLPYESLSDTIVISYMGYKNSQIPIKQLSLKNNRIYLKEDPYMIQEITIRGNNPELILRKSLSNIEDNYYTDPYYITSFYREIITEHDEVASISEAVISVYKSPYSGLFTDQIKLLKSRKNQYQSNEDTISLKLQGGMSASLYLDLIKNPLYFVNIEQLRYYKYYLKEIVNYNNGSAYVISFKPKMYIENNAFEGKIYISTDDLAILAINFKLTNEGLKRVGKEHIVHSSFRTHVRAVSVNYMINYRKIGNKYFINLSKGELIFKIRYKRDLFLTDFKTVFEFAVNNVDTIDVSRFSRLETIPSNEVFIDGNYKYDQDFWGDYNYISPNESLKEALIRIQQKLDELKED